jgi:hypothetical protein
MGGQRVADPVLAGLTAVSACGKAKGAREQGRGNRKQDKP